MLTRPIAGTRIRRRARRAGGLPAAGSGVGPDYASWGYFPDPGIVYQANFVAMQRFKEDFQLALVVTFGIITNSVILPFAIYRFMNGQTMAGLIDLGIVSCVTGGSVHAYVTGNTKHTAAFLAVTYTLGCIAIAYVAGAPGPMWMYALLLSNFLLVERRRALLISVFGIMAVATSSLALPELMHKAAFIGSSAVVCLFAFFFAWRSDLQRRQLEALASLDPLTGACNRRGMHAELAIAMAASARARKPLGLIIFDLDHFKRVNDRFGHEAGDLVLVETANAVRRTTRRNDRLFRLGGEEFALLLPDTDTEALREITEKIRATVAREVRCGDTPITASFGAGVLREGESESEWRDRVDAAMYQAKREGRNRSVIIGSTVALASVAQAVTEPPERALHVTHRADERGLHAKVQRSTPARLPPTTLTLPARRHFGR